MVSSKLFNPLTQRSLTIPNRIGVSPMCQYSSQEGCAQDWHLVHLGSRAVGGAGLVMMEATAVCPEGRISPHDAGLWNDAQVAALRPVVQFLRDQGAVAAIQLAHAGRKASTAPPWQGRRSVAAEEGGWTPVGPSEVPFSSTSLRPTSLDTEGMAKVRQDFAAATQRALTAGLQLIEIHMAHGYLLHSFLSPLSNQRQDAYGGSLENRMRLPLEVVEVVRGAWPDHLPLWVRISASDWMEGGWDLNQSLQLVEQLKSRGVDLIDCSSGGAVLEAAIPSGPGYQLPFAQSIRATGVATAAVGEITEPVQAETILRSGQADFVLLGRELLRDPYWPLKAARQLGVEVPRPRQYLRAFS